MSLILIAKERRDQRPFFRQEMFSSKLVRIPARAFLIESLGRKRSSSKKLQLRRLGQAVYSG
jgi:hypothetical protein